MHKAEIQQVDTARLTWVDTNNRMESIFKPLDHNVLCLTLKLPCSNLRAQIYIIRQLTDIPPTINTPHIGQVSTGILAMYRPVYWLTWTL